MVAIRGQEIATLIVTAVLMGEADPKELQVLLEAGILEATVDQGADTMEVTLDQQADTVLEVTVTTEMVSRTRQQEATMVRLVQCPLSRPPVHPSIPTLRQLGEDPAMTISEATRAWEATVA